MARAGRIGFLLSGLIHLGLLALVIATAPTASVPAEPAEVLTLDLAFFAEPVAAPEPAPAPVVSSEPATAPPEQAIVPALPANPAAPAPLVTVAEPKSERVVEPVRPEPPVKPNLRSGKTAPALPEPRRTVGRQAPPVARVPTPPGRPVDASIPVAAAESRAAVERRQPEHPPPQLEQIERRYLDEIAQQIARHKSYPRAARRRGEQGQVMIRFVIKRSGELGNLEITETSGSRRLDRAALKTLRRAAPFRAIPEVLGRDHWAITVPVSFSLRG